MTELTNIGNQMANVMFNLAQRAGEPLTGDDVALMDRLRKEWDTARRATPSTEGAADADVAKDAARYRYMRNEAWGCGKHGYKDVHVCQFGPGVLKSAITELAEEALDAAIDAAMSASHTEGDQK